VPRGAIGAVQKERTFDLKVISITPAEGLLEHQPIQVKYQLDIGVTNGFGELKPISGSVCPASNKGTCVAIPDLAPRRYSDVIQAYAPSAGARTSVKIKLITAPPACPQAPNCFGEALLTESDDFVVAVAARYEIAVTGFEILKTRAKTKDTVKISLRSQLQSGPSLCNIVGANFCAINVAQGDHGTGESPLGPRTAAVVAVNNVRVGPFDLIPDVSDNLAFEYDVMNLGVPYGQTATQAILDLASLGAAGVLDAVSTKNQGTFDTLNIFAQRIHGLEQCDGPVAADGKLFFNKSDPNLPGVPTLDSATRDTGRFTPAPTQFEGTNSALGCGENSRYRVTWSVIRISWQP